MVSFTGKGFFNAIQFRYMKDSSTSSFIDVLDSCQDGTNINFQNVIVKTPSGRLMKSKMSFIKLSDNPINLSNDEDRPEISFGEVNSGTMKASIFRRQKELRIPFGYKFKKATIFFTGAGFPHVKILNLFTVDTTPLKNALELCEPGTVVLIEKIFVEDSNGNGKFLTNVAFALY